MNDTVRPRPPRIFQHVARKSEWGYALLLEELPDRRTFRFEDGTERSFRPDYFDKMVTVDLPEDEATRISTAVLPSGPRSGAPRKRREPKGPKKPEITMEEQIARFRELFPLGFDDATYPSSAKGRAVRRAQRELTEARFGAKVTEEDFEAAHAAAVGVVEAWKSSVPKADRAALKDLAAEKKAPFARALSALLFGEEAVTQRLDAFIRALSGLGIDSWQLATIFLALREPEEHVLVRGTFMRKQALIVDMNPGPYQPPRASTYERIRLSVVAVRDKLVAAGEAPKDLLDVVAFSKRSLAPKK